MSTGSALANTPIPETITIVVAATVDNVDTDVNIAVFVPAYNIVLVTLSFAVPAFCNALIVFFNGTKNSYKNAIATTVSSKNNNAIYLSMIFCIYII